MLALSGAGTTLTETVAQTIYSFAVGYVLIMSIGRTDADAAFDFDPKSPCTGNSVLFPDSFAKS